MAQVQAFTPEPFGPYLLLSHLGQGGMADVYRARIEGVAGFAKQLVVKRILKIHTADPHFVEMFINEAKIAARLSHPNIVQVYDLGEVAGELFMAMEFVRGVDLLRLMRAAAQHGEPVPPANLGAFIAREVARGLGHAHEHLDENNAPRPIIHRDISPQNVMIGYDGQVKVVDFGIAKAVTAHQEGTRTGSLKGKFGYMAPEQIDTGVCTPQTDVFSVGVVLHEVLTGRRLFKGQTDYDTMTKVKSAPLLPPSAGNPHIHQELDRITMMALERNPARRYQRAAQLARDLDAFLQESRFTVEDAAEWIRRVVPPEERGDGESQLMAAAKGGTPSRSLPSSRRGPTPPQSLGDLAGIVSVALPAPLATPTPSSSLPSRSLPPSPSGRSRGPALLVVLIGGALLLSLGSVLWIVTGRPHQPDLTPPPRGSTGTSGNRGTDPGTGPPGSATLQASLRLFLDSDPSGAQVYAGPRRLGETPLSIDLPGDALDVTLTSPGRPDLSYVIRRSDGPKLMLRLAAASPEMQKPDHHHRHHEHGRDSAEAGRGAGEPQKPTGLEPSRQQDSRPDTKPVGTPTAPPSAPADKKHLKVKVLDDDDPPGPTRPIKPLND